MFDKIPVTADFRKPLFGTKPADNKSLLDASFSNSKWAIYAISRLLKVYDFLDDEPVSLEVMANRLGTQGYATRMLLDVLVGFGLVGKKGDSYYALPPTMEEYMEIMEENGFNKTEVLGWITEGWTSMVIGFKEKSKLNSPTKIRFN